MANDTIDGSSQDSVGREQPLSTASVFRIEKDKLHAVIGRANSGDAEASFNLYHHYRYSEKNLNEAEQWLLLAAQQGHIISQYNLAVSFYKKNELDKALYWASLAKKNGEDKAESLIEKIEIKINSAK